MKSEAFLQSTALRDPTWQHAYDVVRQSMTVPSHVNRLFKLGWTGEIELSEYMKILGFARLNPACLVTAAEFKVEDGAVEGKTIERAISFLGVRLSAVVLAINLTTRMMLKNKPPTGWKSLLQSMMTQIEVGYKFGGRTSEIGIEGGALAGFSHFAGLGILMSAMPDQFKSYQRRLQQDGSVAPEIQVDLFKCAPYQVTAFALQQLGFGTQLALGCALGQGGINPEHMVLNRETERWKAACLWINSLAMGRNFPSDPRMRKLFSEVTPTGAGTQDRNLNLEVLYTEVAKVRKNGSEWTWHLPRPTYDETQTSLGIV